MSREEREIAKLSRSLTALDNGEHWPMTAGERARWNAALVRGGVQVVRGKSPSRADSAMDSVVAEAKARISRELTALQKLHDAAVQAKADAKAKARSESRWW